MPCRCSCPRSTSSRRLLLWLLALALLAGAAILAPSADPPEIEQPSLGAESRPTRKLAGSVDGHTPVSSGGNSVRVWNIRTP